MSIKLNKCQNKVFSKTRNKLLNCGDKEYLSKNNIRVLLCKKCKYKEYEYEDKHEKY
jgi:hypothetical protein